MEELKKPRWFKAVELKNGCKRDHSVWRLMLTAQPSPLLEQDAKRRENCTQKETLWGSCAFSRAGEMFHWSWGHLPNDLWDWTCVSLAASWEDCEHTSSLFCVASSQSSWRPSGIFQIACFPLTSANPVKSKLFLRISNPCFLTWGGKILEILDSYIHTYNLLDLCRHISPILAYTSTLLSLIFNEPD